LWDFFDLEEEFSGCQPTCGHQRIFEVPAIQALVWQNWGISETESGGRERMKLGSARGSLVETLSVPEHLFLSKDFLQTMYVLIVRPPVST
jgi:hypothetical protein